MNVRLECVRLYVYLKGAKNGILNHEHAVPAEFQIRFPIFYLCYWVGRYEFLVVVINASLRPVSFCAIPREIGEDRLHTALVFELYYS